MLLLAYENWCLNNSNKHQLNIYQFLGDKRSIRLSSRTCSKVPQDKTTS